MRNRPLWLPFTSAAIVFAVIVVVAALIGDINLIDMPLSVMHRIEQNKADAIVTAFGLVIVALVVDNIRVLRWERREAERQAEQLRVVGVTMRTVQDIVNNCLNQLHLLHMDAEGLASEESRELFDKAIQETSAKLKALGDLEVFTEKQMAIGSGVDVGGPLALIGNASGTDFCAEGGSRSEAFSIRRLGGRPLAFVADAWGYGI